MHLYDSLEGHYLFLLVLVSRYDNGIRLLQNLLPRSNGEGSVLKRREKEAKNEKRRVRTMRNKTVVSVLIIAVALALPARGSHVDRNEIRELISKTFKTEQGGTCSTKGRRCCCWLRSRCR